MAALADLDALRVAFMLNGQPVSADPGQTLLEVADRHGVELPRLCHLDGLRPDGNCRACVVEIKGERVLAAACCRQPVDGMEVVTDSPRARHSQRMVLELLRADVAPSAQGSGSELDRWAAQMQVDGSRFAARAAPAADLSHPAIAMHLDACIQCTRCVRACREEQVNDVIGFARRGHHAEITFDLGDALGASTCVACGECVRACPTGALRPASADAAIAPDRRVDSVCPNCGVGCQLTYHVKGNRILRVEGRNGPANAGRLCVKGRYGFAYVHHRQRLTRLLIRKTGVSKSADGTLDPDDPLAVFREASWDEALAVATGGLRTIRDRDGPQALTGFDSAKGSNEEAYLFQKLVRTGFGTNNVDHCTRLCHASSVAALLEGLGSAAVSNPVRDVALAEVVCRRGARHGHHGRKPGDVGPRRAACARGTGQARMPGGAGPLPHRDRGTRRGGAAGVGHPREDRHFHQHRPHGATRPSGAAAAWRRPARLVDHPAARTRHGPGLGRRRSRGGVRRDAPGHAVDRRHHLAAPAGRVGRHLPLRGRGRPGRAGRLHRTVPDRKRARSPGAGRHHPGRRTARRGPSDGAHRRPPAGALAYRQHDAALALARRHRAGAGGFDASAGPFCDGRGARRNDHGRVASRRAAVSLYARADDGTPRGAVFIPFCYFEAAANMLTNPALDPFGKIPDFKYCAVHVSAGGAPMERTSFGGGQLDAAP